MTVDEISIGTRLRMLRRWRGMTQAELAGLADLSASFISMVEHGARLLDRRSQIAALAAALKVSETDLAGGPHLSADPLQSDPHRCIPPLRVCLATSTLTDPAADRARPAGELARVVAESLEPLRRAGDYAQLGRQLPDVIDELHYHVAASGESGEEARRTALLSLVDACVCAAILAKDLNYADLAQLAAGRAADAAARLDDQVAVGKASFAWLHTLPRAGSLERNLAAAERAAGRLEPHARDAEGLAVLGMIALVASLTAATLQRAGTTTHWLESAADLAGRVPDLPMANWQSFSATNVGIWRVAIGVERGETGAAVRDLAGQVRLSHLGPRSTRRASYLADVGRGLARDPRTRQEAVGWLRKAEDAAPQRIRNSPAARAAVAYLLDRATVTAGGRELRGMAARMGLPH